MALAERWAARIGGPAYAFDDDTAIRVVEGAVDVIQSGETVGPDLRVLSYSDAGGSRYQRVRLGGDL